MLKHGEAIGMINGTNYSAVLSAEERVRILESVLKSVPNLLMFYVLPKLTPTKGPEYSEANC